MQPAYKLLSQFNGYVHELILAFRKSWVVDESYSYSGLLATGIDVVGSLKRYATSAIAMLAAYLTSSIVVTSDVYDHIACISCLRLYFM